MSRVSLSLKILRGNTRVVSPPVNLSLQQALGFKAAKQTLKLMSKRRSIRNFCQGMFGTAGHNEI